MSEQAFGIIWLIEALRTKRELVIAYASDMTSTSIAYEVWLF